MFDPDAHLPRINRGLVYLGACLIAGIRLAREKQVNVRALIRLGNRDSPFCDWLVHAVAQRALVVEPAHFVTLDTKAGLTGVGSAKRARNFKPRFSHAPNVVLLRSRVYTRSKQSLGRAAILFADASTGFLARRRGILSVEFLRGDWNRQSSKKSSRRWRRCTAALCRLLKRWVVAQPELPNKSAFQAQWWRPSKAKWSQLCS